MGEQFYQYFLTCIDAINQGVLSVDVTIDYFMLTYAPINTEWAHLDRELIKEDLRKVAAAMLPT
jgi:multisubunit Na+/H+ antiporter MnhE subunit